MLRSTPNPKRGFGTSIGRAGKAVSLAPAPRTESHRPAATWACLPQGTEAGRGRLPAPPAGPGCRRRIAAARVAEGQAGRGGAQARRQASGNLHSAEGAPAEGGAGLHPLLGPSPAARSIRTRPTPPAPTAALSPGLDLALTQARGPQSSGPSPAQRPPPLDPEPSLQPTRGLGRAWKRRTRRVAAAQPRWFHASYRSTAVRGAE